MLNKKFCCFDEKKTNFQENLLCQIKVSAYVIYEWYLIAEGTPTADDRALLIAREVVPIAAKETIIFIKSHFFGKVQHSER